MHRPSLVPFPRTNHCLELYFSCGAKMHERRGPLKMEKAGTPECAATSPATNEDAGERHLPALHVLDHLRERVPALNIGCPWSATGFLCVGFTIAHSFGHRRLRNSRAALNVSRRGRSDAGARSEKTGADENYVALIRPESAQSGLVRESLGVLFGGNLSSPRGLRVSCPLAGSPATQVGTRL
jgi:hypothetical protein